MSQGRTQAEIETTNKIMVTFVIAMALFVIVTYTFTQLEIKSAWLQKLEQQFVAKNHSSN